VLPVVTEVVIVEQLVAGIGQHLIQAHVFLGNSRLAVFHLKRAQVVLGLGAVMPRTGAELMQVTVGPAERHLDDLMDLVEKQIRRQLEPAPQRRLRPVEVNPDAVSDHFAAPSPPARWRRLLLEQAGKRRPRGEQALQLLLDLAQAQTGHRPRKLPQPWRHAIRGLIRTRPTSHGDTLRHTCGARTKHHQLSRWVRIEEFSLDGNRPLRVGFPS